MQAVTEIRTLDELATLRVTWKSLWEQTRQPSFHQSYDWVRSYLRYYSEGLKLRTLVVTMAGKPVGIVPFVIRNVRTKVGAASVLTWPAESWATFLSPVGPHPTTTLQAALTHITKSARDWNVIELTNIDPAGFDGTRICNAFNAGGLQLSQTGCLQHPLIQLTGTWDEYLADRPQIWRSRFAQSEQAVRDLGPISFLRWRPNGGEVGETDRRWDYFTTLETLHHQTESCSSRANIELAFLRDVHPAAVDAGAVEICMLNAGSTPIACVYSYVSGKTVEPVLMAASSETGSAALHVLLCHIVRDSFSRRDERVLFRSEQFEFADLWSNETANAVSFGHYAWLSPQAQALRMRKRQSKPATNIELSTSGASASINHVRLYRGA